VVVAEMTSLFFILILALFAFRIHIEGLGYVGSLVIWSPYVILLGLGVGGAVCIGAWLVRQCEV
jgi:hypothetical protein